MAYCSKCGSEIDAGSLFCSNCGATVGSTSLGQPSLGKGAPSSYDVVRPEVAPPKRSSHIGAIVAAIVIVAVLVIAYLILTSSSISPSSSVRDSDGDGVPDATDAAPTNPSYWAWGHGTIDVKVTNAEWLATITYTIRIDNTVVKTDTLQPGYYTTWVFSETFLIGATTSHQYSVTVVISGYTLGGTTTDTQSVMVYDGSVATAEFTSHQF